MIECKQVYVISKRKIMLDNISVCFQKGMIHGIIGKNGSGKTLFLKTISGYLKPNIGTISIEGKQLYRELSFPPSMGLIIEEPGFLYFENAIKNLVVNTSNN